jgi:hypothetical protein
VRRGAAWPARRPSGSLVVRGHTGARLSVPSLGMAAKEVRMPAVLPSPCPRSCPASGVQCPVRASGVRPGPERPGVQCPASGVCASRCPTGSEVAACGGGRQPYAWDSRVGVVAPHVHDGASSAEVGAWRSKLAQAVLGQRRVDLDLVVVRGGLHWTRPAGRGWMRARIAHREAAGGNHAAWSLCEACAWVGWPLRAVGLHCDLSLRPQRGRNLQ